MKININAKNKYTNIIMIFERAHIVNYRTTAERRGVTISIFFVQFAFGPLVEAVVFFRRCCVQSSGRIFFVCGFFYFKKELKIVCLLYI